MIKEQYDLKKYVNLFKSKYQSLSESDIEDVVQEGFLKLLIKEKENKLNYTNEEGLIFIVINNLIMDLFKHKIKFQSREIDVLTELKGNDNVKIDDYVKKLLEKYDEKNILYMIYYEGFKYEEISEIFNMPLNTVKTYVFYTKRKIKKCLKQEEFMT